MHWQTTQPSLLSRLRDPEDHAAWRLFDQRYGDLISRYCRARGLQPADAEDVRQIVMIALAGALRTFRYDPARGRFGAYVGVAVRNAIARLKSCPPGRPRVLDDVGRGLLDAAQDDSPTTNQEAEWERCWRAHHLRLAYRTLEQSVSPQSIAVFRRLVDGASMEQAAAEFDLTYEAVKKIQQRLRARLQDIVASQIADEEEPTRD